MYPDAIYCIANDNVNAVYYRDHVSSKEKNVTERNNTGK